MSSGPEWVEAYLDGSLTPDEERRLAEWLDAHPDHLRFFVRETHFHSQLRDLLLARASVTAPASAGVESSQHGGTARTWLDWVRAWWGQYSATAFAMALGLAALATLLWWINPGGATPTPLGHLVAVVGTPQIDAADGRSVVRAAVSLPVHLGDRLETGDADRAEIRFLDGTTLRLGFNTRVEIGNQKAESRIVRSGILRSPPPLLRPAEVHLIQGQVWTQVQKTTNAPTYVIRTEAATAIARGTEFGVKVQRPSDPSAPLAIRDSPFATVLTVREGVVDFTNAHGTVQATAMTESTATVDSAPTEPRRLETLQVVTLARGDDWSLMSRPLDAPTATQKLVGGGGWVGIELREVPSGDPASGTEVRVGRVWPASPAARAGLQAGDVIVTVEGRTVERAGWLEGMVLMRSGEAMRWQWRRGGGAEVREASLTPIAMPAHPTAPVLAPGHQADVDALGRRWAESGWVTPTPPELERQRVLELESAIPATEAARAAAFNQLGVLFELQDELGPAVRAYGQAVRLAPAEAWYRFNLGLALRAMGSFERAREELAAAAGLAPGEVAIRKHLVGMESLLGREDRALAASEALVDLAPGDHGVWELRAQLLFKAGRLDEAAEAARRAIALDDACPVGWSYLAEALHQSEDWTAAEEAWRAALQRAPEEAVFHLNLGTLYQDQDRWAEAEQQYRRAIELRPNFALAWSNLGALLVRAPATAEPGSVRAPGQRDLSAAVPVLERAATLDPTRVEPVFLLGNVHYQQGQWESSADGYRRALELDPHSAVLHNNLGDVLRLLGRLDEAEVRFRRALELDPGYESPRGNLAILLAMRGRHAEAEAMFRELVAREEQVPTLVNLALTVSAQGRLEEAEGIFRRARELTPADPQLGSAFAEFLAEHRRHLDEALALANRAVKANPQHPAFLSTLGWVQAQRGELAAAELTLLNALTAAGPGNPNPEIAQRLQQVRERTLSVNPPPQP